MLALSYQDLPPQVKPCFLYLMLFPRAFEIPVRRLIHQWCAEGFTKSFDSHDQDIVPEDVAEMYFEELVIRNLIQVTIWRLDGRPKSCRIATVVYDAFCQKASDLGFVYNPLHSSHTSTQFVVRRLSLYLNVIKFPTPNHPHHFRYIRSYVAFDSQIRRTGTKGIASFLKSSISNRGFCLLKVLDLEGVYKPEIDDDVLEKLLRLRYIGLRSTFIEYLPRSVSQLPDLETLDLKHTRIRDILYLVCGAEKLQHLYLNWIYQDRARWGVYLPLLKNLRTLWGLRLCGGLRNIDDLNKLTCLRKLGLKFKESVNKSTIFEWVSQLTKLQSLKLGCLEYTPGSRLLKMAEHYKLNDLYLGGTLLPQKSEELLHFFPPNLRKLTLSLSEIEYDPMPILGELPDLNILRLLADSYKGKQIKCLSRGFPKLHVLKLWKLQELESWIVEEEALPRLIETEVRSCRKLTSIQGLENVTTLKEIVLTSMPSESHSLLHHKNTSIKINKWRNPPL
ncbi:putative disease resistance protein At1g59780 [Pistacia vera]|uniref:putative disease resistance protein At1g59780 n=1 Tax=Pistacia vera TaxID=55513 RepID=UPI0012637C9C|nr:putative disease resistance protein At1g59780 [Pistacia vera]